MQQKISFGCIADDFTGASDAASFLVRGGLKTVLLNGIPADRVSVPEGTGAAVIALKTRTAKPEEAVEESLGAARWLRMRGAQQLYIKYCSTFDSTPYGNIGPVCDAVLDTYDIPYTVLCPSLPVNKRTVKDGILYVDGVPLAESHMKDHPLTPMWESRIPELMRRQSRYPCLVLGSQDMEQNRVAVSGKVACFKERNPRFYIVPDFTKDQDGERIISLFGKLSLLTGGSGLLQPIGEMYGRDLRKQQEQGKLPGGSRGRALIVAGSCSDATRSQVNHYLLNGGFGVKVYPHMLFTGEQKVNEIWNQAVGAKSRSVLVYSESSASENERICLDNGEDILLENALAELACRAVKAGFTRIISAGGETSGAVTKALGHHAYEIGESIAPGVPVMIPLENPGLRLVLKSGNFGQKDFFDRALKITDGE